MSKKKLYACFVDYSKAFDTFVHDKLWLKLIRSGVTGKFLKIVQSMYQEMKSCVKGTSDVSEFFKHKCGLLQGESLSPVLYSYYIRFS